MSKTISNGVWPVMVTPYTEDDKIDYKGVQEILEWYASHNVAGVFAVCQSSEMFFLNRKERVTLAEFIVKNAPKGLGIIASGHVGETIDEQVEDAQRVIDAGVDSYVFISGQFAREDQSEDVVKNNIELLISKISADSFGIYECPMPYKRLISPELLKWCADTGKFSFLKDTCCSVTQLSAKLKAVEGSNLKIFNANAATFLESMKLGVAGYSGVMANFHPDLYVWLFNHFQKDAEMAEAVQDFLGFASLVEGQMYPVNSKYHMQLEGLNINLFSRAQDFTMFTGSRQMEIDQMRRSVNSFRNRLLNLN